MDNSSLPDPEFPGVTHTLDDFSETSSLPDLEVPGATHTLDDVSETSSLPDQELPEARANDNLSAGFDVTHREVLDVPEAQEMS